MGSVYSEMREYDKALDHYVKAKEVCDKIANKELCANVYEAFAGLYETTADYQNT